MMKKEENWKRKEKDWERMVKDERKVEKRCFKKFGDKYEVKWSC